jgi:anti-sigma B factor antagonist
MLGSVTVLVDDDREDPSAADEVAALEPGRAAPNRQSRGAAPARRGAARTDRPAPGFASWWRWPGGYVMRLGGYVPCVSMTGPLGDVPPSDQLMTVTQDDRENRPVLVVRGEVDLSTGSRLRDSVSSVLHQGGAGPVILDLSAVEFLSSSGLGHLVALDEQGRRLSRPLRIVVSETRPVVLPITTMGLDNVLSLFGTVDEAVAG